MCSPAAASAAVAAAAASNTTISGDEATAWAYSTAALPAGDEEAACVGGFTREGAYLVCMAGFLCLTGPWVFFDISNLGFVQMFATVVRCETTTSDLFAVVTPCPESFSSSQVSACFNWRIIYIYIFERMLITLARCFAVCWCSGTLGWAC